MHTLRVWSSSSTARERTESGLRRPSRIEAGRSYSRRSFAAAVALAAVAAVAASTAATVLHASGALVRPARPTCATVSVPLLDAQLGIDAVAVHAARPSPSSLICSYYGASGRIKNEATIVYLSVTATPAQFAAVIAAEEKTRKLAKVPRIGEGAYAYELAPNAYLYMLDGRSIVQLYAAVALTKVEALARRIVPLVRT
jgi:hypothetical protein